MRYAWALAALLVGSGAALAAGEPSGVATGDYVEVRTAEVFTGGCIMGSDGETSGRDAIMAWRVSSGVVDGVSIDGLSVVAVVAADSNLGTHELGGAAPTVVRSVVMVDDRASRAQQKALVQMARSLAPGLVNDVVALKAVPITFRRADTSVQVTAGGAALDVATKVRHSPVCGAIQWFDPLARVDASEIGLTRSQSWSGTGLGAQWKQVDRKSSFVGTFSFGS